MASAAISLETDSARIVAHLSGRLVTEALGAVEPGFARLSADGRAVDLDLSALAALDTGGACLVALTHARLANAGADVRIVGAKAGHAQLLETVTRAMPTEAPAPPAPTGFLHWVAHIGENTVRLLQSSASLLAFLGLVLHRLGRTLRRPRELRLTSLVAQMQEIGFNGIPIIVLMGLLIGVVLAYQGAAQLRQFGAEVFVVDLIAISVLRELGIMLTAVIVAGRSGSAFAASIGSMKVREELDAMRTLGLDPIVVLVLPRVLGLIITLPILGFIANISALVGGALMSWVELGVSPAMFLTRLVENTDVWHFIVGMIKAPFFALTIGVSACWQAMQVGGSAESVGRRTTASVVQSTFLVILIDAAFSIFFAEIGV